MKKWHRWCSPHKSWTDLLFVVEMMDWKTGSSTILLAPIVTACEPFPTAGRVGSASLLHMGVWMGLDPLTLDSPAPHSNS